MKQEKEFTESHIERLIRVEDKSNGLETKLNDFKKQSEYDTQTLTKYVNKTINQVEINLKEEMKGMQSTHINTANEIGKLIGTVKSMEKEVACVNELTKSVSTLIVKVDNLMDLYKSIKKISFATIKKVAIYILVGLSGLIGGCLAKSEIIHSLGLKL